MACETTPPPQMAHAGIHIPDDLEVWRERIWHIHECPITPRRATWENGQLHNHSDRLEMDSKPCEACRDFAMDLIHTGTPTVQIEAIIKCKGLDSRRRQVVDSVGGRYISNKFIANLKSAYERAPRQSGTSIAPSS